MKLFQVLMILGDSSTEEDIDVALGIWKQPYILIPTGEEYDSTDAFIRHIKSWDSDALKYGGKRFLLTGKGGDDKTYDIGETSSLSITEVKVKPKEK